MRPTRCVRITILWGQPELLKIKDVVSLRFVRISNGNIINTLLFFFVENNNSVFAFEVDM